MHIYIVALCALDIYLWNVTCAIGGVYLDLDSAIAGPLDAEPRQGAEAPPVFAEDAVLSERTDAVFMYDAEANLIQWVLIAAPRHPVLHRAVQLATQRVLPPRSPRLYPP